MKVISIAVILSVGLLVASTTYLTAQGQARREDCTPYNPATLRLEDRGPSGWLISRDDGARFMVLDTKEDADVMMQVFKAHSAICYVGRNNKRPNRDRFVHYYWK